MRKEQKIVTRVLFGIYLLLLIWIILFKMALTLHQIPKIFMVNLIPFHYDTFVTFHWWEVLLNVIIFIPFGIYLKLLEKETKKIMINGFLCSLLLESLQLLFQIGVFDVTDLITNTLGTILGVAIYQVGINLWHQKARQFLIAIALVVTIIFLLLLRFYYL